MPHLVELRRKYGKDGLEVITLNIDDEKEDREKAQEFLKTKKIAVTNVMLDETRDFATEKLRLSTFPAVFVFNREGKYVRFPNDNGDAFGHEDVEKRVAEFLGKK